MSNGQDIQERLRAVEILVKLFQLERHVYLAVTSVSVLLLLLAAGKLLMTNKPDVAVLVALFGSSGLITYSVGRLLHMWNQSIDLLKGG